MLEMIQMAVWDGQMREARLIGEEKRGSRLCVTVGKISQEITEGLKKLMERKGKVRVCYPSAVMLFLKSSGLNCLEESNIVWNYFSVWYELWGLSGWIFIIG